MLELKNVTKIYQKNSTIALKNVSYFFPSTGLFYVVGPSGSGKSTLLRLLSGIDRDFSGHIKFNGVNFQEFSEIDFSNFRKNNIALSFQTQELEKEFSVFDNVDIALLLKYSNRRDRKKRAKAILQRLEIYDLRKKSIGKLSGGEKGRVSLARALGKEADVYLLDEPLNGLNRSLRLKVTELLEEIARNHLVIAVTHQRDEIFWQAGILEIDGGVIKEVRRSEVLGTARPIAPQKTKHYNIWYLFKRTIKKLCYNPFRLFCTSLTIMVSLISFGLAFLISTEVAEKIEASLMSNIAENILAIEKKNLSFIADETKNADAGTMEKMMMVMKSELVAEGTYYTGDFGSMFPNENRVFLKNRGQTTIIPSLTFKTLIDTVIPYEADVSLKSTQYQNDEIALGLTADQFKSIFPGQTIEQHLSAQNIINIKLKNSSWGYEVDILLTVKEIVLTPRLMLIHPSSDFVRHLITTELELSVSDNLESTDRYPWTVKSHNYVIAKRKKEQRLVAKFYKNTVFKNFDLRKMNSRFLLRFFVQQRRDERLDIGQIQEMLASNEKIYSYSFTTPLYQFGDEGLFAGFNNPFYLATDKAKINTLVDSYYQTSIPVLTSLNIKAPADMIGGDIYGSLSNNNFIFEALGESEASSLQDKIIISSSLAEKLNFDESLNSSLHYAYLVETQKRGNNYYHTFKVGKLEVHSIRQNDKLRIYQSPFFLSFFGLTQLDSLEAGNYQKALVRIDEKNLVNVKKKLQAAYPNYYFTLPGLAVKQSLDPTLNLLKMALYGFAIFSFAIAAFLLTYSLLLVILEDRKSILTKYALGFNKKELLLEYSFVSLIAAAGPGFSSAVTIYAIQFAFATNLSAIIDFSAYRPHIAPSLLVFFLSIFISLVSIPFISLNLSRNLPGKHLHQIKKVLTKKRFKSQS